LEISPAAPVVKPVAYSYVRFSTVAQLKGDSLRRQVEACEEYCASKGLELHPVSYRDLGVSAFKRRNIEKGALAAFITAVKTGKVAKGSYLIIEQFDRLTRADADVALKLLLDLVHSGITVVTLDQPDHPWTKASIKETHKLMLAIVFMSRANNESVAKSDRLKSFWKQRKADAATTRKLVTSECPRWLKANQDKTGFVVLEDRAASIRKVFEMRIGGYGITHIVRRANQEGWPAPGKPSVRKSGESVEDFERRKVSTPLWHTSTVGRLLKNRALLGEYQPHGYASEEDETRIPIGQPVAGYYPAILDETTFLRAQAKTQRSGRFPGRRDASLKNWLQGLLLCTCGHSFVRKNKDSRAQPEYARYYCTARNRGISDCPGANAKELETAVLHAVSLVAPQYFEGTARMEELKARLDLLQLNLTNARFARDNYAASIASQPRSSVATLVRLLDQAEDTLAAASSELDAVQAEIADLSGDTDAVFENIVKAVKNVDSLDARAALREELSRVIEKAVVHQKDGYIAIHFRAMATPVIQPLRMDASLPQASSQTMTAAEHQASLKMTDAEYGAHMAAVAAAGK